MKVHKCLWKDIGSTYCGMKGSHKFSMNWLNVTCGRCLRLKMPHECNPKLGYDAKGKCNWCGKEKQ